ncbi:MAG: HAD domain-containing protein [Nocardioidaceae bacterium]
MAKKPKKPRPPDLTPIVCLDHDGVLNAVDPDGSLVASGAGWERFVVDVTPQTWPYRRYLAGPPPGPAQLSMTLNPGLHGTWIKSLLARGAQVGIASTWEETWNMYVPELLGVPELPMAISHAEHDRSKKSETADQWKARALADRYQHSKPLVWVDDWAQPWAQRWTRRSPENTLVIPTDERVGLTKPQMDQIDEFVDRFLEAAK